MTRQLQPRRRTLTGEGEAESQVHDDLTRITQGCVAALGSKLAGLLLVGGYARGEGSVVSKDGRLGPYNDYDLVAFVRGNVRSARPALESVAHDCRDHVGVDVDVFPMLEDRVADVPATLFWLDVALGAAEWLVDEGQLARRLPARHVRDVPLEECGRLLSNRAVGLALSNLEKSDADFRRARHAHKAVLACGDSWLIAANRYPGTLALRRAELERLADAPNVGPELVDAYVQAVRFRARPDAWVRDAVDLPAWYERTRRLVASHHLRFEHWRLGAPRSVVDLACWSGRLYATLPDARLGPLVSAVKLSVQRYGSLRPYYGHPRERLARAAALLAYSDEISAAVRLQAWTLLGGKRVAQPPDADELHAWLSRIAVAAG